jgi:2-polyprenyl-6-methoxyphenol hydroxylase-like FAD-dependent oxidoreductase
MTNTSTKTEVIIIGAGPTGLALACQLIRYGIDFVIIDKKETTTPFSKAIGVQARTLEIYEQIGLADRLVSLGQVVERARFIVGGEVRGEANFREFGEGMSPYPFVLIVEQGKHEKLLHDYITSHGKEVRWLTELESFSQDADGVLATIKTAAGESQTIEGKYLVGCDGAKSPVRHHLGMTFQGSTFERTFYVADVDIDWDYPHDAGHAFLLKNNLLVFFPMSGEKQWRIVGTFPEEFAKDEGDVLYEEIEEQIKRDAELDIDITKVNWFSTYKVHTRGVNKFSEGRCFLAGDSAHIHTPAGAQGMNTGIQDGYNLAWKIAMVLRGANESLLETYNEERLANAKALLETTDRFFNLAASPEAFMSFIRMHIFPYVAGAAMSIDAVKKFLFPRISQIAINYRNDSLSEHVDDQGMEVKAGDRMPYFIVDGESIYEKLHAPKFHLLTFWDGETTIASEALPDLMIYLVDRHTVAIYPRVAEIFGTTESFRVLVRPDNYIATISKGTSLTPIENYLKRCL